MIAGVVEFVVQLGLGLGLGYLVVLVIIRHLLNRGES